MYPISYALTYFSNFFNSQEYPFENRLGQRNNYIFFYIDSVFIRHSLCVFFNTFKPPLYTSYNFSCNIVYIQTRTINFLELKLKPQHWKGTKFKVYMF